MKKEKTTQKELLLKCRKTRKQLGKQVVKQVWPDDYENYAGDGVYVTID